MEDDNSGRGGKVAKLLPKGLTAKGRWRKQPSKESFESTSSREDVPRGRSPRSREVHYGDGHSDRPWTSQSPSPMSMLEEQQADDDDDDNVSPGLDELDDDT